MTPPFILNETTRHLKHKSRWWVFLLIFKIHTMYSKASSWRFWLCYDHILSCWFLEASMLSQRYKMIKEFLISIWLSIYVQDQSLLLPAGRMEAIRVSWNLEACTRKIKLWFYNINYTDSMWIKVHLSYTIYPRLPLHQQGSI